MRFRYSALFARLSLVLVLAGLVVVAHQGTARAVIWPWGGYYGECNVDFNNGLITVDLFCTSEEVHELYGAGSGYREECYGEGCSTEERYELAEGPGDKAARVHNMMLNHFCFLRTGPNDRGYRRGVKTSNPTHFRPFSEAGLTQNFMCYNLGADVKKAWCTIVPDWQGC